MKKSEFKGEQSGSKTKPKAPRAHQRWTQEEQDLLTAHLKMGWSLDDIAKEHKRSRNAIKCQLIQRVENGEPLSRYPLINSIDIQNQREKEVQRELAKHAKTDKPLIIDTPSLQDGMLFKQGITKTDVNSFIKDIFKNYEIIIDHQISGKKQVGDKVKAITYTFGLYFPKYNILVECEDPHCKAIKLPAGHQLITYTLTESGVSQCIRSIMTYIIDQLIRDQ